MTPPINPEPSPENPSRETEGASQEQTAVKNERPNSELVEEANNQVLEQLKGLQETVKKAVEEDSVVEVNGKEWELTNLSDHYKDLAYKQEMLDHLEEMLDELKEENKQTQPGSDQEAITYFKLQKLASVVEVQETQEALAQKMAHLREQSPELLDKLVDEA